MIRDADPGDVEAITELESSALGGDGWSAGLVREGVTGRLPTIIYLVAEVDGRVRGYAAASIVADIAELQRIAVDDPVRRSGIATNLLAGVVHRARGDGADRLLLEVRPDNAAALAFYTRSGFVEIDRRARYYRDGAEAVVMQLAVAASGEALLPDPEAP